MSIYIPYRLGVVQQEESPSCSVTMLCRGAGAPTPETSGAIAVREDFFGPLATIEGLAGRYTACVEVLTRPSAAALRETLVRPAALFGEVFEDEALVDTMVEAAADRPAALALLQFCADQLWDRRDPDAHRLTRAAFVDIGGVEGALARHADSVIDALPTSDRTEARRQFLRLVTSDRTREPRARADLIESGRDPARAEVVLDRLIDARLIAISEAEDGAPRVEVVHEALLGHWGRLAEWLDQDLEGQRMTRSLGLAAAEWERRGGDPGLLWRGDALLGLGVWLRAGERSLTPLERRFADASERLHRRARARRRLLLGVAVAALAVVAVGALGLWQRAERIAYQAQIAREIAVAQRERARGHSQTAARVARETLRRDPSAVGARTVLADRVVVTDATLQLHTDLADQWTAWSPDLTRFVVAQDGEVWLLDEDGARLAPLPCLTGGWKVYRWAPDSRHVVVRTEETVTVVDRDGRSVASAPATGAFGYSWATDASSVSVAVNAPDGGKEQLVLSVDPAVPARREPNSVCADSDSDAGGRLVGLHDGPAELRDPAGPLLGTAPDGVAQHWTVSLSPDGRIAMTSAQQDVRRAAPVLWGPGREPVTLTGLNAEGNPEFGWDAGSRWFLALPEVGTPALFSTDGTPRELPEGICKGMFAAHVPTGRFALGCFEGEVRVFDRDLKELARWRPDPDSVDSSERSPAVDRLHWSADGERIATLTAGGHIRISPALGRSAAPFASPAEHPVVACSFDDAGDHVAAMAMDGTVTVWDRSGRGASGLPAADARRTVPHWHPEGGRFVIAAEDGFVVVDVRTGATERHAAGVGEPGLVEWHPDGDVVVVVGSEGGVLVSTADGGRVPLADFEGAASRAPLSGGWSPDGSRLLAARDEGEAWLWDDGGELLAEAHRDRIFTAAWHPSSDRFHLSGAPWEKDVRVLSRNGEELWSRPGVVTGPWDPAGERWVVSLQQKAHLATSADGAALAEMPTSAWLFQTHWSPDGRFLASGHLASGGGGWDGEGRRWCEFRGGQRPGAPACFDPKADRVLVSDPAGGLRAWPLTDEALLEAADALFPQELLEAEVDLIR